MWKGMGFEQSGIVNIIQAMIIQHSPLLVEMEQSDQTSHIATQ